MIHADKKSARKWQEMPIPFPTDPTQEAGTLLDPSGISQLPQHLRGAVYKE